MAQESNSAHKGTAAYLEVSGHFVAVVAKEKESLLSYT